MKTEKESENKRYYHIVISGRGGCRLYGKSSREEYDYWHGGQAKEDLSKFLDHDVDTDFDFSDSDELFRYYMDEGREPWDTSVIPESVRRQPDWLKHDDLAYVGGAYFDQAWIAIEELSSVQSDATVIRVVCEERLTEFCEQYNISVQQQIINIEDPYIYVADRCEKCYGSESFFADVLILDDEICLEKFAFGCDSTVDRDGQSPFYVSNVFYSVTELGKTENPYDRAHWLCPSDEYIDIFLKKNDDSSSEDISQSGIHYNSAFGYVQSLRDELISASSSNERDEEESAYPLAGRFLLSRVRELRYLCKHEIAQACGYFSHQENGRVRINLRAFYEALLDALGISFKKDEIPITGRRGSYRTRVRKDGTILISYCYIRSMDLQPYDELEIKLLSGNRIELCLNNKEQDSNIVEFNYE